MKKNKVMIFGILVVCLITVAFLAYLYLSRINCPKYVDCMPSINGKNKCEIPLMCKGVTKTVY